MSSLENNSGPIICKNCQHEFEGNYCPNCGQSIKEFNRPIRFLVVDMLGTFFAFDTRFWNTFGSLAVRPGRYASEYLAGRRARFAPPFRVYLFVSLIFFLLLSAFINQNIRVPEEFRNSLNKGIDRELSGDTLATDSLGEDEINIKISGDSEEERKGLGEALKTIMANPQIYINSFLRFLSWCLFFLMPVYAAVLWLLFKPTRPYYFGHLVFSLNQHALIFLVFSVILIIKLIFSEKDFNFENYLALYIPVYLYIGTFRLYGNSHMKTFFKMILAWLMYSTVIFLSMGAIVVLWYYFEF